MAQAAFQRSASCICTGFDCTLIERRTAGINRWPVRPIARTWPHWRGALAGVAALGSTQLSYASFEAWRLKVSAPDDCVEAAALEGQLASMVSESDAEGGPDLAPVVDIEVWGNATQGYTAALAVEGWRGRSWRRSVEGATCAGVVDALQVVLRLALQSAGDPERALLDETVSSPPIESAQPVVESNSHPPALSERPSVSPPRPPVSSSAAVWKAGGSAQALSGMGPTVGFGPALFVARSEHTWLTGLEVSVMLPGEHREGDVSARFSALFLTPSLCRNVFHFRTFSQSLCLGTELGALRAEGVESDATANVNSGFRWWGAGRAQTRQELDLGPLAVFLSLELRAPWSRHRFVFERPQVEVHRVPALAWGGTLGFTRSL